MKKKQWIVVAADDAAMLTLSELLNITTSHLEPPF